MNGGGRIKKLQVFMRWEIIDPLTEEESLKEKTRKIKCSAQRLGCPDRQGVTVGSDN